MGGCGGASGSGGGGTGGSGTGGSSTGGTGGGCVPPEGSVCDTVSQCGCDTDENCHFELGGSEPTQACVAVGEVAPYSPCESDVDCVRGHGCVDGVCKQYCHTVEDCGGEFVECLPFEIDGEPAHPDWNFCERRCDVIAPDEPAPGYAACGAGAACIPAFETPISATSTSCQSPGEGDVGDACSNDGGVPCGPGLTCEFGQCLPWCDLALDDCPGELPCIAYPFPTGRTVMDRELGVCFDGVLAQDDFSDPDSGWWETVLVRPLIEAEYLGDEFWMSSMSHGYTLWDSIGPSNGADMVVEVDTTSLGGKAMVVCRDYWFQMDSSGQARIAVWNPNYNPCLYCSGYCYYYDDYDYCDYCEEYYDCDANSVSDLGLTDWVATDALEPMNHIAASCVGNSPVTLTLHINGELVLEVEESAHNHTSGWAGLGVTDFGYASFDNYFVWEP